MRQIRMLMGLLVLVLMSNVQAAAALLPDEQNTIQVFQHAAPFVVNVHNIRTVRAPNMNLFDMESGTGSGLLWDKSGRIVTNFHVVRGASKLAVTLKGGKTSEARVIGIEPRKDIAVLQLQSSDIIKDFKEFASENMADSAVIQVGQKTIAIGDPFGLDHTVTSGIVSAVGRQIPGAGGVSIHDMIQTDASINPGNSGGPLLDSSGHILGMNTIIFSRSGTSSGIGFAVPANDIKRIVSQIIRYGRVKQPGLGVKIFPDQLARQLGIQGVIIRSVMPNSPAAQVKLKGTTQDRFGRIHLGDIIVGVNKQPVKNYDELYNILDDIQVGTAVELKIIRDGSPQTLNIKTTELTEY